MPQNRVVLSIVIVSWNTRNLLKSCLHTIRLQEGSFPLNSLETIVIDNDSSDGSVQMIKTEFPDVVLVENQRNVGFSSATNQGIRLANGSAILLLNPDTEVFPGSLQALIHFMETNQDAGAAGARLISPDGSLQASVYPSLSLAREFWRLFHLDRISPIAIYPLEKWNPEVPRRVDVVQGACMILRREALDEVGLLDEGYFMYTEDVDLCYRLAQAGWQSYWVPEAKVLHLGGQSTRQKKYEMFIMLYKSKIRFFRKHYGRAAAWAYKLILALAAIPRLVVSPLNRLTFREGVSHHRDTSQHYRRLIMTLPYL